MKETVRIEKYDNDARGIVYIDNKITFIPKVLVEEEVEINITKEEKRYNEAEVISLLKPSPLRCESVCPYFDKCGGCDLLHTSYDESVNIKKQSLEKIFQRALGYDKEIDLVKSTSPFNYRNKITLKIVNGEVGYYEEGTHDLVKINKCLIASNAINNFIEDINLINVANGELIIRSNYNDELLISVNTEEKPKLDIDSLKRKHKIAGIVLNDRRIHGENYFMEKIQNYFFKISYNSFFQVNSEICSKVFDIVEEHISGKNVLDMYCGVGTLGIVASISADSITGVEIVPNAIKNALVNAKMNKCSNIFYLLGNTNTTLTKIDKEFDSIIVDPPRSGLDKLTTKYLVESNAKTIMYISCNPQTLTRDLLALNEMYNIEFVKAYDMFPYTKHIECVVLLSLNKNDKTQ